MKNIKKSQKYISIVLLIGIVTNYFFGCFPVYAESSYKATTTGNVNFRSEPTTSKNADGSSNVIEILDKGVDITITGKTDITGNGCNNAVWLKANYDNNDGYICSLYVEEAGTDAYNRPWNTPEKAINGGAKWISNGYIGGTQYTSYLKKFNVNPDSGNSLFNHQYMANIHAPSSEAYTSYKAYSSNGLLNLPLVFNIPVYLNMAEKYDSPRGNLDTVNTIDVAIDLEFETTLDNEGFPESYKKILRYLHSIHPNWVFKAMQTGLDFSYAVSQEKITGATQYSSLYEYDSTGNPIKVESGWYEPSTDATAYYLDPRNFLTEKYILQFEALNYSDVYTEAIVQSVLDGTFMSGVETISGKTYAALFMEAGKSNNVSPVYLASLSRQEVGTKGSITTTGEVFEYEGTTYSSLYNFYNIGAKSSASNPVREGLKYASGGVCTICGDYIPSTNTSSTTESGSTETPVTQTVVSAATSINNIGAKLSNNYIKGFTIGSSIATLKAMDNNVTYSSDDLIATGTKLSFADGNSYTAVLVGDLSGDGKINSADLLKARQHLLGTSALNGAYKEAADINGDGKINSADLLLIRKYLLGQTSINQL